MKKVLVVFAILFVIISSNAYAEESEKYLWLYSSKTESYYLDVTQVAWTKENHVDVWLKVSYTIEGAHKRAPKYTDLSFSILHEQYDINPARWRILSEYLYNSDNEVIFSYNWSGATLAWDEIIPSSRADLFAAKITDFVVNHKDKVHDVY